MNRGVHYELTRVWALDAGFAQHEAEVIAAADWAVDAIHSVREWKNKGYHFAWLGARRRSKRLFETAVLNDDLVALGEALHCTQDAIGHGHLGHVVHWRGIDRWEQRGARVRRRLEHESRTMLAAYRSRREAAASSTL